MQRGHDRQHEKHLIYLVFNTIFNLTTQEAHVRCFKNAARHLSAKGVFVVETVVPDFSEFVDGQRVKGSWAKMDSARFEIAIHDRVAQTVAFLRIVISVNGTRMVPHFIKRAYEVCGDPRSTIYEVAARLSERQVH